MVKLLLDAGADPNTRIHGGHTLLNCAVFHGHFLTVKVLLNHGGDPALTSIGSAPSLSGPTDTHMKDLPLHTAVARERPDIVQLLIDHGADINARDASGENVMHIAVANNWGFISVPADCFRLLSTAGADINARRSDGKTALNIAMEHRDCHELVQALCECAPDVNMRDSGGETALHHAARLHPDSHECMHLPKLFHLAGANLDAQNSEGRTALHIATELKSFHAVRRLLDCGASFDMRDSKNDTALHVAIRAAVTGFDVVRSISSSGIGVQRNDEHIQTITRTSSLVSEAKTAEARVLKEAQSKAE